MHVEHLLGDESLGLRLLWADSTLLRREISGVTVTDLADPSRFVRPGEAVLSGLVWWRRDDGAQRAERFVAALRDAGAAVLLAGEETHGTVPADLVAACERHRMPLAAVPAPVLFRAITDTVYLRRWGELSRHHALPEQIRGGLSRLLARDAGPDALLAAAFAHLDRATAYVLTPSGRTVAATEDAPAIPAEEAAALVGTDAVPVDAEAVSPYEHWHLYLPDPAAVPPRMLHDVAAVLGRCQESAARRRAADHQAADELGALLAAPDTEPAAIGAALRACGLPPAGRYRVLVAEARQEGHAEAALTEATAHTTGPSAVGRLPDGAAFALVPADSATDLARTWALVTARAPEVTVHAGAGTEPAPAPAAPPRRGRQTRGDGDETPPTATSPHGTSPHGTSPRTTAADRPEAEPPDTGARGLSGALAEARWALASVRATSPGVSAVADSTALDSLGALLTGIPAEVRALFSRTVLGPLLRPRTASTAALLETLETFLAHDGSWARTADALHLHVNTVHYRVARIERLTGRDLSRLSDRLDLWAALLCRPDHGTGTTP
ncbi:helix-turn-helix domain-containing protein [Streptomyces griseoviridis]|uniref:helix-turn-helix domain-containing protein n=1 Tax=Streptomyces griseoviridis TaxID=45398 RepID=UPI0034560E16